MDSTAEHLIIIGGGSAAFAGAHEALALGARVTMCNDGLPMGGTCPNVGCVPSKTLIRAAEAYHRARHTGFPGLKLEAELCDFGAIMEEKQSLVDELRIRNYEDWVPDLPDLEYIPERAQLIGPGRVRTKSGMLSGDHVLLATGAAPHLPDVPGLRETRHLTSQTAFELDRLPESLLVLGGGYIALECAQMFSRFGSRVTLLQRSNHLLSRHPAYLGEALREYLEQEGIHVRCGVRLQAVSEENGTVVVDAHAGDRRELFSATDLLVATGRRANTGELAAEELGLALDEKGFIRVNDMLATSVPGVYAAGDVIGDPQFVYTASYEAEVAVRNAITGHPVAPDYTALPWVIFTDPQVAGVGMDEEEAAARGHDVQSAWLHADRWPRLKVARDTRGFLKLIRDKDTDHLLGARILAAEGGDLVTELGLAIRHGITVSELANSFHPYLTLSEGIQRAAQQFAAHH